MVHTNQGNLPKRTRNALSWSSADSARPWLRETAACTMWSKKPDQLNLSPPGSKPIYSIHLESHKPWHDMNISNVWIDARSYAGWHRGQTHQSIKEIESATNRTGRIIRRRRIWIWRLSDQIIAAECAEQNPLPAKAIRRNQAVRAAGRDLHSSERRGRAYDRRKRSGGRTPGSAQRPADLAIGSGSHTHTCVWLVIWWEETGPCPCWWGDGCATLPPFSISLLFLKNAAQFFFIPDWRWFVSVYTD